MGWVGVRSHTGRGPPLVVPGKWLSPVPFSSLSHLFGCSGFQCTDHPSPWVPAADTSPVTLLLFLVFSSSSPPQATFDIEDTFWDPIPTSQRTDMNRGCKTVMAALTNGRGSLHH